MFLLSRAFLLIAFLAASFTRAEAPLFEIGKFSLNPAKQIPQIQPMADHVAGLMTNYGYESGKARIYNNFDSARAALADGSLDMLTLSLYEAAQMIRDGESEPLVIKWKNGLSEYSSLIVVDKDSDIYSLEDLVGKTIAFEDYGSTSAYFVPLMAIQQAGLTVAQMDQFQSAADPNAVNFRYTGAEQNSSVLLFQEKVDAIALSDFDWLKADHVPIEQKEKFRIIWVSDAYPAAIEVINSQIPSDQKVFLRDQLTHMHLDAFGRFLLDEYHESSRFSLVTAEAANQLQGLIKYLEKQPPSNLD